MSISILMDIKAKKLHNKISNVKITEIEKW